MSSEFQATHPSGVRRLRRLRYRCGMLFQSTHPSGVRLHSMIYLKTND